MTHVITEVCLGCMCGSCAEMCPVDAIVMGDGMLLIHPEICIDCEACVDKCERNAIYSDHDLPEELHYCLDYNREESDGKYPVTEQKEPIGFPRWQINRNKKPKVESCA